MKKRLTAWFIDDRATAAIEAGILFPLLVLIMCGTIDIGMGALLNQKTINATQMVSDLMTRSNTVSTADINDAIVAGNMAFAPFDTSSYGVDIASIEFVGTTLTPTVEWRVTQNINIPPTDITSRSAGLGLEGEGVIAVTVNYTYHPIFTSYMTGTINMHEESYARSRKGTFVQKSG